MITHIATILLATAAITAGAEQPNPYWLEENHIRITIAEDEQSAYFTQTFTYDKEHWLTNYAEAGAENFEHQISIAESFMEASYKYFGFEKMHEVKTTTTNDNISFQITSHSHPLNKIGLTSTGQQILLDLSDDSLFGGLRHSWPVMRDASLTITHKGKNLSVDGLPSSTLNRVKWEQKDLTNVNEIITINTTPSSGNPDDPTQPAENIIQEHLTLIIIGGAGLLLIAGGIVTMIILRRKANTDE